MTMTKSSTENSLPRATFDRAVWTPLLDFSVREVFEIMLSTTLQRA